MEEIITDRNSEPVILLKEDRILQHLTDFMASSNSSYHLLKFNTHQFLLSIPVVLYVQDSFSKS